MQSVNSIPGVGVQGPGRVYQFYEQDPAVGQPTPLQPSFTEFYCDAAAGSNLNPGTGGTNDYTTNAGNWVQSTRVFTVTDGTNPADFIKFGEYCSVYVTAGATVAAIVARVTAVQNAVNGTVTFSLVASFGNSPANGTGTMTLKHGGFWKGPNGASAWPLDQSSIAAATNLNGDHVRINLKNGTSYSITATMTTTGLAQVTVQGYTTTPGDGGKATIDGGTTAATLWTEQSNQSTLIDLILVSSATSGLGNGLIFSGGTAPRAIRVVVHGARNVGIGTQAGHTVFIECEAYNCNTGNSATAGGFWANDSQAARFIRCFSHDNVGSNNSGFYVAALNQGCTFIQCIAANNGLHGFQKLVMGSSFILFQNCDAYNNGGDGIKLLVDPTSNEIWIENCNFLKNKGRGINLTATSNQFTKGFVYNCGFGTGTQSNESGDVNLGSLIETGRVTYPPNVTPWVAPSTGDFSTVLAQAISAGRGAFTETDGTNTGTVSYPDIGAAQAQTLAGGLGSSETTLKDGYLNHTYYVLCEYEQSFTVAVTGGSLPPGLLLSQPNPTSFLISGTPTAVGAYSASITMIAPTGGTGTFTINITTYDDPDEGVGGTGGG